MPQALNYSDVADLYDAFSDARPDYETLPQFAQRMNQQTGTDSYSAGLQDNFVKRASRGIDKALDWTHLPDITEEAFAPIGAALGMEDTVRQAAHGLPRGIINFAPMLAAGLVTGGAAPIAYVGGAGLTGLLTGSDTYTETGSAGAGLLSGLTAAAIGPVAEVGGQVALRSMGAELAAQGSKRVAKTLSERLAEYAGGQAAALTAFELSGEAQSALQGEGLYNPFTSEHLVSSAVGQLPFIVADIPRVVRGHAPVDIYQKTAAEVDDATVAARNLANIPQVVEPTGFGPVTKSEALVELLRQRREVQSDPDLTQPQKQKALDALESKRLGWIKGEEGAPTEEADPSTTQMGIPLEGFHVKLTGTVENFPTAPNAHFIRVDSADQPGYEGKRVIIPKSQVVEMVPGEEGKYEVTVPKKFVQDAPWEDRWKTQEEYRKAQEAQKLVDNPNLPEQTPEQQQVADVLRRQQFEQQRLEDRNKELSLAALEAAKLHGQDYGDVDDYQEVISKSDDVRKVAGDDSPTTDAELKKQTQAEIVKARGDLTVASEVVTRKEAADAANKTEKAQAQTKRQQDVVERQVAASQNYASLEERALKAKVRLQGEGTEATLQERQDQQDRSILNRHLEKAGSAIEGRSIDIPNQMIGAYHRSFLSEKAQADIIRKAGPNATQEQILTQRAKALESLMTKVAETHKVGKTVTGGQVLKESGKWSAPDAKTKNMMFDSREAAQQHLAAEKERGGDVKFDDVQVMKRGEKFYLQERPRESTPESINTAVDERAQTQAEEDAVAQMGGDPEFDKVTGSKTVGRAETALEVLKEATGEKGDDLAQVLIDKVAVMDDGDVALMLEDAGQDNDPSDVQRFKSRTQVLMQALKDGEISLSKVTEASASRLNDLLQEKGVAFKTEAEAAKFAKQPVTRDLMRAATEQVGGRELRTAQTTAPVDTRTLLDKASKERMTKFGLDQSPTVTVERLSKMFKEGSIGHLVFSLLNDNKDLLKNLKFNLVLDKAENSASHNKFNDTISIDASFLGKGATDAELASVVAHEVLHGVTQKAIETYPNHPMVKELDRLREQAINALPKEYRDHVRKLIEEKQLEKFRGDEIPQVDFGPGKNTPWEDVMYGLLDTNEFVAQSFSSNDMQRYLNGLKSPASKSLFRRVVESISKFFGGKNDNALYQTMVATTRLFDKQRTLIHFEDVIRPMLRNAGVTTPNLMGRSAAIQSLMEVRPVGLTVEERTSDIVNRQLASYDRAVDSGDQGLSYYENRDLDRGNRLMAQDETSNDYYAGLDKEFGIPNTPQFTDTIGHLIRQGSEKAQDYLEQVPLGMSYIARSVAQHGLTNLDILSNLDEGARKGLLSMTPMNPKVFDNARESFQQMHDAAEKVIQDNQTMLDLQSIEPMGFLVEQQDNALREVKAKGGPSKAQIAEDMNMRGPLTKIGQFFKHTFMPAWQYAKLHPVVAPVIELAFDHQSKVRRFLTEAFMPFGVRDGVQSKDALADFEKTLDDPYLSGKVDDLIRLRQTKGGLLDYSDAKDKSAIDAIYQGMTPDQQRRAWEIQGHQTMSMIKTQEKIVEGERQIGEAALGTILQKDSSLNVADNRLLAKTLLDNIPLLSDPAQAANAQKQLLTVRSRLGDDLFPRALEFAAKEVDRIQKFSQFFNERPWFATEQNFKKFVVKVLSTSGKTGRYEGDTLAEAKSNAATHSPGSTVTAEIIKQDPNDGSRSYGMNQTMLDKIVESENTHIENLKASGVDQATIDDADANRFSSALRREMAANALYKPGSERKGALGRETLPMLKNHLNYVSAVAHAINKRLTRQELWFRSNDPDLRADPTVRAQGTKHIENFLASDSEAGRALSSLNFYYYLGLNLSSHVIEGGQSLLSHAAQLTAEGAGVFGGYKRLIESAANIKDWALGKRGTDTEGREIGWINSEHGELMKRAKLDGEIGLGMWDEVGSPELAAVNAMRLSNGKKGLSLSDFVKKPLAAYQHVAGSLYGIFTHFNARLALLSSFDHYRSKGLSFDDAYQKAREFNRTANFQGGRAARPVGLFESRGQVRTASMMVNSLQSYQNGMISMFHRFFSQGFGKADSSLSVVDRGNARKAALQLFGTQLAAAGVLGLPFVGASIALLEQLFPDLELRKNVRELAHKAFDDDQEAGGLLSNIALQGVPSQLGVDAASRLGIGGNIAGLSEYNGFDVKNILGPSFGLLANMANGIKATATGDLLGGMQSILPPAYKKVIDLARNGGDLRDPNGGLLLQATPGEKFAYAIGFRPKEIADAQDAKRLLSRSAEIRRRETEQFHKEVASQVLSGDTAGAKRALVERATKDPTQSVQALAAGVGRAVEARTMPADIRRTASGGSEASQALASYALPTSVPSELERLRLRKNVERTLGIPGAGLTSSSETYAASLVDSLMAQNSNLTRSQARQMVEQRLHPSNRVPDLLDTFSAQ